MDAKAGYGIVYREIMRRKDLTPEAKAIYSYLCSFAGSGDTCYPGLPLMCKELRMSVDRFYRHLRILTETGIVSKAQERKGGKWENVIYKIHHVPSEPIKQNEDTAIMPEPIKQNEDTAIMPEPIKQNEDTAIPLLQNPIPRNNYTNINSVITKSSNNINNKYMVNALVNRVCKLLNNGLELARSQGRLKPSKCAISYIEDLLDDGITEEEIIGCAEEIAAKRIKEGDWLYLNKVLRQKRGRRSCWNSVISSL